MCGIVGVASARLRITPGIIESLRDELVHRGPDDAGLWISPNQAVGIGHRRLAIIDLSPKGHQPMSYQDGKLWITFNGEIYNYKQLKSELEKQGYFFQSDSDTEVILAAFQAWGQHSISKLNGAFAFAIFDQTENKMILARDRAGEKPLYYAHLKHKLIFASELKSILSAPEFPRYLDIDSLNDYLAFGYVLGNKSIIRGIQKLPPAHYAVYDIDNDILEVNRYWQMPEYELNSDLNSELLVSNLEILLQDSVQKQLVADVPIGILLSGGVDSSLITALACKVSSKPVNTFTITFPEYKDYDESAHARLVARYFGTHHIELVAEPQTIELLPLLAKQYDEPIADTSIIPTYLVSKLIRQYAKVALGGDGGDELFGGYPYYSWLYYLNQSRKILPGWTREKLASFTEKKIPIGVPGRNHFIGLRGEISDSIAHLNMLFDQPSRRSLLEDFPPSSLSNAPEEHRVRMCMPEYSWLRQATEADFRTTMVEDFLVKVDRASMLNSLEIRTPFLDFRLIEFAFGQVPDDLKVVGNKRKILLKDLAKRLLPPTFDFKRKQGFVIPMDIWFKNGWGKFIESLLLSPEQKIFSYKVVNNLIDGQLKGLNNTRRLFALTMFELWRQQYQIIL